MNATPQPDPPRDAARRLAGATVSLAVLVAVMDGIMLNVALPRIGAEFGVSPARAMLVVNLYQAAVALCLLPLGGLAETLGYRRVYAGCIALFGAASLLCATADGLAQLAAGRVLQGAGAAGVMGLTNAMLRSINPPERLADAIAANAVVVALSLAAGPVAGSLLLETAGWRAMFFVTWPPVVLLLALGIGRLPDGVRSGSGIDLREIALFGGTTAALLGALLVLTHVENGGGLAAAAAGAGLALGLLFARSQIGKAAPLLPLDLLARRSFALSVATIFFSSASQVVAFMALPFYLMVDLGLRPLAAGVLFTLWPAALAVAAPVGARISRRVPTGLLCAGGLAALAAGLIGMALSGVQAQSWQVALLLALCGIGYGIFQPPNSRALVSDAPMSRSGSASVMSATGRVLGQAFGAALVPVALLAAPSGGQTASLCLAGCCALAGAATSLLRDTAFARAGG